MDKRLIAILTALMLAASLVPATAATSTAKAPGKPPLAQKKSVPATCPVLGTKIADRSKAPKSVYKGKTYYFCCKNCKQLFDKNPEKYIKKQQPRK